MAKPYVAESSATTSAPLEKASRAITDPANYPKWFKGARKVVAEGYPAVGGVLSWTVGWGSKAWAFRGTVVENGLPRRLVMRVRTPSGESDITHSFEQDGAGTRYTKRVEFHGTWVQKLLMRSFLPHSVRHEVQAAAKMADGEA